MRLFLLAVLVTCTIANPQYVKSRYSGVKGGYDGPSYQPGENLVRYNNTQPGYPGYSGYNNTKPGFGVYNPRGNLSQPINYEKGVCYIEVPTASLAKDPSHVPAGNGSSPDLSRIRTCCKGYIKNIHNFRICDPVCTNECINALCTEPEVCSCFPQHVKNLAGICIPTCPIGCQNGQCAGGECICKDGYRLDSESKFCIPVCRENCGGIGNCTAPNTCECKKGYISNPQGSCKPQCDNCGTFSQCVAPNQCQCLPGYLKNQQGNCLPQCANNCLPNGRCVAPNKCDYPITTTTTIKPIDQYPHGAHNVPLYPNVYPNITRDPNSPGQQYPGNQQSNYPGNQQPYYPGNQPPNYPGYQTGQSYPGYPNNQNSNYPANHPSNNPDQQTNKPNSHPIYYNPGQQPNNYPGSQHGYYDQQRPNYPDSQQSNSNLPSVNSNYPAGQNYPTNQYPVNQHYYPQHPNQQQGIVPINNQPTTYTFDQQGQRVYPDSQIENFETLCAKPCINGNCIATDKCICNDGYILDESDPAVSRCKPHCPGGCPNGVCSSPNFCICNQGYYKDHSVKGRANCVKRIRRAAPVAQLSDLLVFEIPDYDIEL